MHPPGGEVRSLLCRSFYRLFPCICITSPALHDICRFTSFSSVFLPGLTRPLSTTFSVLCPLLFTTPRPLALHALIECCVDACYDRDHTIRLKAGGEGGKDGLQLWGTATVFSLIEASVCNLACLTPAWHRGQSDWQTTRGSSGAPDGQSAPEVCGVRNTWFLLAAAHLRLQWAQSLPAQQQQFKLSIMCLGIFLKNRAELLFRAFCIMG